ncbi:MAG: MFS transporter [Candidatus Bathyarchaeia archaeon]
MVNMLAAIITVGALSSLCLGLVGPVYPIFVLQRVKGSLTDIGLLYAIFYFTSATIKIFAGKLVDKYGKERIFVLGGIVGAICTWGYVLSSNQIHLYLLEFINGLAYALQRPAFLVLLAEATKSKSRGFEMGVFDSIYDLAGALASLASALIVVSFGFDFLFYLCSGFQVTSGFVIFASHRRYEKGYM